MKKIKSSKKNNILKVKRPNRLGGFNGKIKVLWATEKTANLLENFEGIVQQMDYIVVAEQSFKKKFVMDKRIIRPDELVEISIDKKSDDIVVFYSTQAIYSAIKDYLTSNGIYNIIPLNIFDFFGNHAYEFEKILMLEETAVLELPKDNIQAILLRGAFEPFFTRVIIKQLKNLYPNKYIVLSTWETTPANLLVDLNIDKIILNQYPDTPGQGHRNYQIRCVVEGLKHLKDRGFSEVFIQRTDQIFFRENLLERCKYELARYPSVNSFLNKRILMSDTFFRKHIFYHPSDMFMYGEIDDLFKFWDVPFDDRNKDEVYKGMLSILNDRFLTEDDLLRDAKEEPYPEIYYCKRMLEKLGVELKYTQQQWDEITRDFFIIRDTGWWQLYWFKPDRFPDGFNIRRIADYPLDCVGYEEWLELNNSCNKQEVYTEQEFKGHYIQWMNKRINAIINYFGKAFFSGKSILELGCGFGDIGAIFSKLGANITCSDGRQEHLEILKSKYPNINTVQYDLDREWPFNEKFDIIIHMGVLYHIKDYKNAIKNACQNAKYVVLETEVSDSDDPNFVIYTNEEGYEQVLNHIGCRPSEAAIESILDECNVKYYRLHDSSCNYDFHKYDWEVKNTNTWQRGMRRLWFIHQKNIIQPNMLELVNKFVELCDTGEEVMQYIRKCLLLGKFADAINFIGEFTYLLECLQSKVDEISFLVKINSITSALKDVIFAINSLENSIKDNDNKNLRAMFVGNVVPLYQRLLKDVQLIKNIYC